MSPAAPPATLRTPSASSRTEKRPRTSDTSRAWRTPTPNAANDRYSSPVNTGAMYNGFHASFSTTHDP
jgi:hypothetical protein